MSGILKWIWELSDHYEHSELFELSLERTIFHINFLKLTTVLQLAKSEETERIQHKILFFFVFFIH